MILGILSLISASAWPGMIFVLRARSNMQLLRMLKLISQQWCWLNWSFFAAIHIVDQVYCIHHSSRSQENTSRCSITSTSMTIPCTCMTGLHRFSLSLIGVFSKANMAFIIILNTLEIRAERTHPILWTTLSFRSFSRSTW